MPEREYNMSVKLGWYHRVVVRLLSLLLICVALMASGCTSEAASQWAAAQEASEGQRATAEEAVAGSEFNALFPESQGDFEVVYTQEKIGFVEATLKEDGTEVATLSIFDTVSSPEAADKYAESEEELEGYPLVAVGSNGTAILVADRFQVQVRSKTTDFTEDDRKEWLAQFDLVELGELE
jgi:hypothetical protein